MHLIITADGTFRQSLILRILRTIAYLFIGAAGTLLILSPTFIATTGILAQTMAWFLLVGGFLSSVGAGSNRWFGEFSGLPLLASSFLVFGIITFRDTYQQTPFVASANFFLLAGIAGVMLARWRVVLAIYDIAKRFRKDSG